MSTSISVTSVLPNQPPNVSKIPFENSRIMDECRVEVLRKFRKEIVTNVRFGDTSRVLISCGLVSKEECFEICKLPMSKQMAQCYQKVHDIMDILVCQKATAKVKDKVVGEGARPAGCSQRLGSVQRMEESDKQNGLVKDIWKNFIRALKLEHGLLAGKMENELDRSAEKRLLLKRGGSSGGSTRSLVKKGDIGCPRDFQHVQHYGVISDKRRVMAHAQGKRVEGDGASDVVITNIPILSLGDQDVTLQLDENDPDLKEFFRRAGVVARHLTNPLTKQTICRFIMENGGMEAIREEVRRDGDEKGGALLPHIKLAEQQENVSSYDKNSKKGHQQSVTIMPDIGCVKLRTSVLAAGRSFSEGQLAKTDGSGPPPAPATVPFQPTPRPTSNLFYF